MSQQEQIIRAHVQESANKFLSRSLPKIAWRVSGDGDLTLVYTRTHQPVKRVKSIRSSDYYRH